MTGVTVSGVSGRPEGLQSAVSAYSRNFPLSQGCVLVGRAQSPLMSGTREYDRVLEGNRRRELVSMGIAGYSRYYPLTPHML